LVRLQLHKNDWHVRHARRILQERAAAGTLGKNTGDALRKMLLDQPDVTRRLRALWALHAIGGLDEEFILELLRSPEEYVRGWIVQLALEKHVPSMGVLHRLVEMAAKDSSPFVRLYLASALQRLRAEQRWDLAESLVAHAEDAEDANLPLMLWYGIEPLATYDSERFVGLIAKTRLPLVRELMARRVADSSSGLRLLVRLLGQAEDGAVQRDTLRGIHEAFNGRRQVAMPADWPGVYRKLTQSPEAEVRDKATFLAVLFDDAQALATLRSLVRDASAKPDARRNALQALVYKRSADLLPTLQELLDDPVLRGPAVRGLAAYNDAAIPGRIVRHYASFTEEEKADAIHTLASRPAYAHALLDAVDKQQIARRDLTAFTVRQLQALKDKQINDKVAKVWGVLRPASQEKAALMAKYKTLLTPDYLKTADRSQGRHLFARTCVSCHVLFGEGGKIGPELTGSQRANLDYVLENILDPSAVVASDYQVTLVQTKDGRLITGIIKQENDKVVTVQTQNESIPVLKSEIEERTKSAVSMMPEGLLDKLKNEEVRDLVAYLGSPAQVSLPRDEKKAPAKEK